MLEFFINKRPLSWNGSYAGMHWTKRRDLVSEWKTLTREKLKKLKIDTSQIKYPLLLLMIPKNVKPLDCDNHGSSKLIIDAIKDELSIDDTIKEFLVSPSIPKKAKSSKDEGVVVRIYDQDEIEEFIEDFKKELLK